MLRQTVKYTDFNGDPQEEVLYFNLTRTEALALEMGTPGGLLSKVRDLGSKKDVLGMYRFFEELVLKAYGKKSSDGRRFEKSSAIREEFAQSAAFDEFIFSLMNDETGSKAVSFVKNIFPKEIRESSESPEMEAEVKKELDKLTEDGVY